MKKIKIKYEILISGFPEMIEDFKFLEFSLKKYYIKEEVLKNYDLFNTNMLLEHCMFTDVKGDTVAYYFENDEYMEYEIQNRFVLSKEKIPSLCVKYPKIIEKIYNLIKEIRLTFNIPVGLSTLNIIVYDEKNNLIGKCNYISDTYIWHRSNIIDLEEFNNNLRCRIDLESFIKINNVRYQRALSFFNRSFDDSNISIRFIMLISFLESLFNYNLRTEESITNRVATISSNLLGFFESNSDEYYEIIKNYYNKRSKYLHGDNNIIDINSEKMLRKYTRIILLFYSIVIIKTNKTTNEMIKYLLNPIEFDINEKLILSSLLSNSFDEQQLRAVELVEKELGKEIPTNTKKKNLSNVKIK